MWVVVGWCLGPWGSWGGLGAARVGALWCDGPVVVGSWVSCRCGGGLAGWAGAACCSWPACVSSLCGGAGGLVGGGVARCRGLGQCALVLPVLSVPAVRRVGTGLVGGLVVNCIVDASIFDLCGVPARGAGAFRSVLFVFMSVRWMPWHQGPMKDVVACDKPRGAG